MTQATLPDRALGRLHAHILQTIVDTGRAPSADALARALETTPADMGRQLRALQAQHGVVLHPHADEVWIAHPFCAAPTLFSVHAGEAIWWANCAWCALGAAALVERDCRITSTLGGHGERVDLEVRGGEVIRGGDLWVHFPVPMARAWDNVVFTCSVMLLFDEATAVDRWSHRHGLPRGDLRRVRDLWPFARAWYGQHLSPDWQKVSVAQARALFARHGLTGPIWSLPEGDDRF